MLPYLRTFFSTRKAASFFERGYYANFTVKSGKPELYGPEKLEVFRNIPYRPDAKGKFHFLDVYRPKTVPGLLPVILFVHGGGWRAADKEDPVHIHQNFCRRLAVEGFVVASANYRLAPATKHPEHVTDVADAIGWIAKNIGDYGGDPSRLHLSGHSAGGHICAFLYTHPSYLEKRGVEPASVKCLIGISGVYDLIAFASHYFAREFMIRPAFGSDPETWKKASPVHAESSLPVPILLINAQHYMGMEKQSLAMLEKFKNEKNRFFIIPGSNHFLVIAKFTPPVNIIEKITGFIRTLEP